MSLYLVTIKSLARRIDVEVIIHFLGSFFWHSGHIQKSQL